MLNREKHQVIMGRILHDIYTDITLAPHLGFKGGTCALFFYNLSRFSVDLDFDLLNDSPKIRKNVFEKIIKIASQYGEIKDKQAKHYTLFALLSYGTTERNIKIEINTRTFYENILVYYEPKEYQGISMLIGKKEYLFGSKLAALTSRKSLAMRDVYDIHFFAKNNWDIDTDVIKIRTNKSVKEHLSDCISYIETIKEKELLSGLGELITDKEKVWIRNNLIKETVFLLKNYANAIQS